jgi:GAF domain-containing protein
MMVAPLRTRDRIIGTVTVSRTRSDETYSSDDLGVLDMLAERAASAISRIVAASQRMSRMIDQLLDVTRARVGGGIEIQVRTPRS